MKKNRIIAGLTAGVVMLMAQMLIGKIFQYLYPVLGDEYVNSSLFRPWTDARMSLIFLHPFLVGIILAFVWSYTKDIIKKDSLVKKGIHFGLIYWMISVPGMLITYSTFTVSCMMVLSWTIGGFAQALLAGLVFAKMIR